MVAQDHPDTLRRTPASGDGGIDLMIPHGAGYEVRQVKRFTGRLGSSERRQIAQSWERIRADPRLERPITAYRLVVPIDPTPEEQAWFEELVADAPWPASWLGAVHWHDLASRHAHVIDYFFAGGRDRVAKRAVALQAALTDPTRALSALDVAGAVATMQSALNKEDPHYRYDIRTSAREPAPADTPDAVLVRTQQLTDGTFVTISVTPKHRYSLQDAPIQGTLKISVPDVSKVPGLREKIKEFEHFGRALDLPPGTVAAEFSAPGGLGGSFEGGGAWVGPAPREVAPEPLRLAVVSPAGDPLADLVIRLEKNTVGPAGGAAAEFRDDSAVFTGTLRISPPLDGTGTLNLSFALAGLEGRPVVEVLPAVRFLSNLRAPNEILIRPQYGNQVFARTPVTSDPTLDEGTLFHLEDLAVLQDHAPGMVPVPAERDADFAAELHEWVRLQRGEVITGTWDDAVLDLTVPREELTDLLSPGGVLAMDRELTVELEDQTIVLGFVTTILHTARLADEQPADQLKVRIVPREDATFTRRAGRVTAEEPGGGRRHDGGRRLSSPDIRTSASSSLPSE